MKNNLQFKEYFLFTQHSLATFDNCPLKFRKRYLENLKWDSFPDIETKKRLEQGNDFHLLAYRYFLGIDTGMEAGRDGCGELESWFESLKKCFAKTAENIYLPEYKLRMASGTLKLEANFDLLIIKKDAVEIWDWKTHGGNRDVKVEAGQGNGEVRTGSLEKKRKRLAESLQTLVYMYVLKEKSGLVAGRDISCENISMHYWQPDEPHHLADISYNADMHLRYGKILQDRIENILGYDYGSFDRLNYAKHCPYCEFNWFCNNERINYEGMKDQEDFLDEFEWDDIEEKY